jgi:hypothetical protein
LGLINTVGPAARRCSDALIHESSLM